MVKNLPANAGIDPWSQKLSHAWGQLSPRAAGTELQHLEPVLHNKRSQHNKKPMQC